MAKVRKIKSPHAPEIKHDLRFPVNQWPEETDLLSVFPELSACEEFVCFEPAEQRNQWIRYVMYYVDEGSWFVRHISDIAKRQQEALNAAGIDDTQFGMSEALSFLYRGEHFAVNKMVSRFFRIVNNLKLEYYLTGQEMFRLAMENIRTGVSGITDDKEVTAQKNKIDVFVKMDAVMVRLGDLETDLFRGNKEVKEMVTDLKNTKKQGIVEMLYSIEGD